MSSGLPEFTDQVRASNTSVVHLEMRDVYTPNGPVFVDWKAGIPIEFARHQEWVDLVRETVARGVRWQRARIVSEPVTQFIRYEYESATIVNVPAGEDVRWLPRRRASDLCLPGNDFWVFDDRLVRFTHFSGDGDYGDHEWTDEADVIKLCSNAFASVWERAVDHKDFKLD